MFMDGRNLEELLRTGWHIKYRLTKEFENMLPIQSKWYR